MLHGEIPAMLRRPETHPSDPSLDEGDLLYPTKVKHLLVVNSSPAQNYPDDLALAAPRRPKLTGHTQHLYLEMSRPCVLPQNGDERPYSFRVHAPFS